MPADLLTVTLNEQRAFIYFMLRTTRGNIDPQSTRTVLHPLVTMRFPIPLARPAITLLEQARTRSRTLQALTGRAADWRWTRLMPHTGQLMSEPQATPFATY